MEGNHILVGQNGNGKFVKVCPRCEKEMPMTVDHVIPQWLIKYVPLLHLNHHTILNRAGLKKSQLKELVCVECNMEKLGYIDWQDKFSRRYLRAFIDMLDEKYYQSVSPRKLFVICKCKECEPTAKVWSMGKVIQEPSIPVGLVVPKEITTDILGGSDDIIMPSWAQKKIERYENK
jgi:ribosomal protein S27E